MTNASATSSLTFNTQWSFNTPKKKVFIVNMPLNANERLPAILRDELRRVVALKCFDVLFRRDRLKISEQRDLVYDMFHGNERRNVISICDQLCSGDDIFADLYEDRTDIVLSRQSTGSNEPTQQLRMLYSRREKSYLMTSHINLKILSEKDFKTQTLITGRTIHNQARKTLGTVRKACAVLKQYVKEDGTPKFSGDTIEDVVNKLLDDMYEQLKGKSALEIENDVDPESIKSGSTLEEENSEVEEENDANSDNNSVASSTIQRPTNWMFHGFMACLLFGPMARPEKRLSFFMTADPLPKDKKNYSRAAAREQKRKNEADVRSLAGTTDAVCGDQPKHNKRGMTVADRVRIASLELQLGRYESDKQDSKVIALKFEADVLEKKIDRAIRRAANTNNYDEVDKLEDELDTLRSQMTHLRNIDDSNATKKCRALVGEAEDVVVVE